MTIWQWARRSVGDARSHAPAYAAVAAVSLALGIVGALIVLRRPTPPIPPAAVTAAEGPAMERQNMPDMPAQPGEAHPNEAKGQMVYISPARQQLIGVRTATVARQPLRTTLRTVGTLAYDERRVTQVNTKIAGWADRVFVDYVGKFVRRGEPLLSVYSPALVATQREYLLALEADRSPGASTASHSLRAATRERLKLWDISDAQIDELERGGEIRRTLTLYAPFDGVVLERNAFAGQYITPEMSTVKLADLSTIWVVGQIFEYELGRVTVGQEVEVEFPYGQAPNALHGKITFIYPDIDPQTRRVKFRAEFPNRGFAFKPDSYVTLVLATSTGEQIAVPKEAVIDTGARRYVILAHPNGYFEPREIEVGPPSDQFYPVVKGLREGETIATSALFLIDSETNLEAAMQAMAMGMPGMNTGEGGKATHTPSQSAPPPESPAPPSAPTEHQR